MVNKSSKIYFKLSLVLAVVFVLLFTIAEISAAEIQILKTQTNNSIVFAQGETFVAKISGNFVDQPTLQNTFFYRAHVKIPMDFEMKKINEEFYVYASLIDKQPGNYSIALEGVRYMSGNQVSDVNITKNFTVSENISDFSVTPGFVEAEGEFSLQVLNLQPNQFTLNIKPTSNIQPLGSTSVIIKSGEVKTLDFIAHKSNLSSTNSNITLSTINTNYTLPVFVSSDLIVTEINPEMKFEPKNLEASLSTSSETKRIVYLVNTGNVDLENITFFVPANLAPYITLVPESQNLNENATQKIELLISSDSKEKVVEGKILASTKTASAEMTLTLNFIEDYIPTGNLTEEEAATVTCSQINGNLCTSTQECSGQIANVLDGQCCLAQCTEVKKSSSGKIIGWSIIVIVILALFWFYKRRYKRVGTQLK